MTTIETDRIDALKARLKDMWSTGDYGIIAQGMAKSGEEFALRHLSRPGERVLDIACGAGQVAIPLARAGADVTGVDICEAWVDQARARAATEGLSARFDVGDAEDLPYADERFDLTISLIGAMFAPRPERVVEEMVRVTRPGGRIVMGNWTADGFVGRFFRTVAAHAPPPDMPSPLLWGDPATVRQRLGDRVTSCAIGRDALHFDCPFPPEALVPHYVAFFGPLAKAAASLDDDGRAALEGDLVRPWSDGNTAGDGTTQVDGEIIEVVAVRA